MEGNTNTGVHYGEAALWILDQSASSITTVENVVFRNNEDPRARDISVQTFFPATVRLINNVHLAPTEQRAALVVPSEVPPVVQILKSCNEVAGGHRGYDIHSDVHNEGRLPQRLWLEDPSSLRGPAVLTPCLFVPVGGVTSMHEVHQHPVDFPVEGWNVVARREEGDGNIFAGGQQGWNEYRDGFENVEKTAWWFGNERLHKWTTASSYAARFDVCTLTEHYPHKAIDIPVEQDFSKWNMDANLRREIKSNGDVVVTYNVDRYLSVLTKTKTYCTEDWAAAGGNDNNECTTAGGKCYPAATLKECQDSCDYGDGCKGVNYKGSTNGWCLPITLTSSIDDCSSTNSQWTTLFLSNCCGEQDFLLYVDLAAEFRRCPTCRMRLTIDGEATVENDVELAVGWININPNYWHTPNTNGGSFGEDGGTRLYLPMTPNSVTYFDFNSPPYTSTSGKADKAFEMRINLKPMTWGTSFTLRSVKLAALNECGEMVYDEFEIDSEDNYFRATYTNMPTQVDPLKWTMGQNFARSGSVLRRQGPDVEWIGQGTNFSTHDKSPDDRCLSRGARGPWWFSRHPTNGGCLNSGMMTGVYPTESDTGKPLYNRGVGPAYVVSHFSSTAMISMSIKPTTSRSASVVATCADLFAHSDNCAKRCVDRQLVHGSQHPMGVWCRSTDKSTERQTWWASCETCRQGSCSFSAAVPGRSPGSNLGGSTAVTSLEACQALCCADARCLAVIYYSSTGGCYLLDRTYEGNFLPSEVSVVSNVLQHGDDDQGDGTFLRPLATISTALSRAVSGDLVQLGAGVYGAGDNPSCKWCTEMPLWRNRRCALFIEAPLSMNVESVAECLARCRDDDTCAYAAFSTFYGTKLCRWSSERQCTLRPARHETGFDTYYCPKNRTKRCNFNLVVDTDNITVAGPPLSLSSSSDDSRHAILDCEWSYDQLPQQRRGFIVEAGIRFTLQNIVIRRCRAGCGPPFYDRSLSFDTVFSSMSEAREAVDAPSRLLCSGGGLAAKAGTTVVMSNVVFDGNRGKEGGAVAMVGGAIGVWRDVLFESNTADAAAALLVTSGSQIEWRGGGAKSNCARGVESAVVEISDEGTLATLVGVTVSQSVCDVDSNCWRRREHAYRAYLCRDDKENLFDESNVRPQPLSACVDKKVSELVGSGHYKARGNRWPRRLWSSYIDDDATLAPADCVGQVDRPHGVRVTGSVPGRSVIGSGDFDNGMPIEDESGSWMSHGDESAVTGGYDQWTFAVRHFSQLCLILFILLNYTFDTLFLF